jgi:SAM-dependent methyltransferase
MYNGRVSYAPGCKEKLIWMEEKNYEWRDLLASTWDLLRGDTSGWEDRSFYLDVVGRFGQPVLIVGCGTGRLLLDYLIAGMDVSGLDNSPEMLAICRQKAAGLGLSPNLFEGWMESLDLPLRFRTVIVPSSNIQLIIEPSMVERAMGRFHGHLKSGGVLAVPFMIFRGKVDSEWSEWWLAGEKTRPEDGALIRRHIRTRNDAVTQLQDTENRFEVIVDGEIVASEIHTVAPATRWYNQSQALALFQKAGFTDAEIFKGSSHKPASEDDRVFTILGIKP